jgi:hypothetical protein
LAIVCHGVMAFGTRHGSSAVPHKNFGAGGNLLP